MKESVVYIESPLNSSFGTGFVIYNDDKGSFILTCQHVVESTKEPKIGKYSAKVITSETFIDMAVLYVENLFLEPLSLEIESCNRLEIEVIGFSSFDHESTQKEHIEAKLYAQAIERHAHESSLSYSLHKIKAHNDFNFNKGNSGSPVICKEGNAVVAMVSNRQGSEIAYAIDIINLQKVWKEMPKELFTKVEKISGNIESPKRKKIIWRVKKIALWKKYGVAMFLLITLFYFFIYPYQKEKQELKTFYNKTKTLMTYYAKVKEDENSKYRVLNDAPLLVKSMEATLDDKYLQKDKKLLKYKLMMTLYAFSASLEENVDKKIASSKKIEILSEKANAFVLAIKKESQKESKRYNWMIDNKLEEQVIYYHLVGNSIRIQEGENHLIPESIALYMKIEKWYSNPRASNQDDNIDIFLNKFTNLANPTKTPHQHPQ